MTNYEKYESPETRADEFEKYCKRMNCVYSVINAMTWLELKSEDELPLCPYCRSKTELREVDGGKQRVVCTHCCWCSSTFYSKEEAKKWATCDLFRNLPLLYPTKAEAIAARKRVIEAAMKMGQIGELCHHTT